MKSWISPKAKKGLKSKVNGIGLFAMAPIKRGETIAIKKGRLVTEKQIKKLGIKINSYIQIADNSYVGPASRAEFRDSMVFINHSCNPNVGFRGKVTVVAIRNIKKGEEIFIDYAMYYCNTLSVMKCNCHSINCRKIITGKDWENPKLQEKYRGYLSSFIQKKINKLLSTEARQRGRRK